ncbi:MAG: hypothetical protein R6U13_11125 [Desulfatiglandaceae bacterium]
MPLQKDDVLIDPRPLFQKPPLKLTARLDKKKIANSRLMLFDNTKLDVGNYYTILSELKAYLSGIGFKDIRVFRQSIRGKNHAGIVSLARDISGQGVDAVVLMLADIGVSPAMVMLSIELEKLGIPNVCITGGPGNNLARAVAYYQARNLCLLPLDVYPGNTALEIKREIREQADLIFEYLTVGPVCLKKKAAIDCEIDRSRFSDRDFNLAENGRAGISLLPGKGPHDPEVVLKMYDEMFIGDGLPIIPPTKERLFRMMLYSPLPETHVFISSLGPSGASVAVRDLALGAVMAGCRPQYMPILTSAMEAMSDSSYNLFQAVTTSHGGGHLILISGPLTDALDINCGQGCMGPGVRANATIGRAVQLTLRNRCRVITGFSDLACLSSPAEYSYCFAEDVNHSPWPTINVERFNRDTTTVTVLMAEGPHNIMDLASTDAGGLLETVVDCCTSLGSNNAYLPGNLIVVLTPDHARLIMRAGLKKSDLRSFIHQRVGHSAARLAKRGIVGMGPKGSAGKNFFSATRTPEDIEIVMAGGKGGHSAVIIPWSMYSRLVIRPVLLPDGRIPKKIEDFRAFSPQNK